MRKEIYIFRSLSTEDHNSFRGRMFELAEALLEQCAPESLKLTLTTKSPPRISIIPFKKDKIAVFSLSGRDKECAEFLSETPGFGGGYLVQEAVPVAYEKTWEDRKTTPGACLSDPVSQQTQTGL